MLSQLIFWEIIWKEYKEKGLMHHKMITMSGPVTSSRQDVNLFRRKVVKGRFQASLNRSWRHFSPGYSFREAINQTAHACASPAASADTPARGYYSCSCQIALHAWRTFVSLMLIFILDLSRSNGDTTAGVERHIEVVLLQHPVFLWPSSAANEMNNKTKWTGMDCVAVFFLQPASFKGSC